MSGGNSEGTKCGRPKLARSSDLVNWATCSLAPGNDNELDPRALQLVSNSQGKLSLVFQNTNTTEQFPAGIYFWREP